MSKRDGLRPMSEEGLMESLIKDGVTNEMTRLRVGTVGWDQVPEPWKSRATQALWVDNETKAVIERWYKTGNWWVMDKEFHRTVGAWAWTLGSGDARANVTHEQVRSQNRGWRRLTCSDEVPVGPRPEPVDRLKDVRSWTVSVMHRVRMEEFDKEQYRMVERVVVEAKETWIEDGTREEVVARVRELKLGLVPGEWMTCQPVEPRTFELDATCVRLSRIDVGEARKQGRMMERELLARGRMEAVQAERQKTRDRSARATAAWKKKERSKRALAGWEKRRQEKKGTKKIGRA